MMKNLAKVLLILLVATLQLKIAAAGDKKEKTLAELKAELTEVFSKYYENRYAAYKMIADAAKDLSQKIKIVAENKKLSVADLKAINESLEQMIGEKMGWLSRGWLPGWLGGRLSTKEALKNNIAILWNYAKTDELKTFDKKVTEIKYHTDSWDKEPSDLESKVHQIIVAKDGKEITAKKYGDLSALFDEIWFTNEKENFCNAQELPDYVQKIFEQLSKIDFSHILTKIKKTDPDNFMSAENEYDRLLSEKTALENQIAVLEKAQAAMALPNLAASLKLLAA